MNQNHWHRQRRRGNHHESRNTLRGRYGYPKDRPFGGKEPNGEAMEIYLETTNPSLASEWSHRDIHQDD